MNRAEVAGPPSAGAALLESRVLALVNTEREAVGCGPLVADDRLAAVARAHSADMRSRAFFDHVDPDGVGPFYRAEAAGLTATAGEHRPRAAECRRRHGRLDEQPRPPGLHPQLHADLGGHRRGRGLRPPLVDATVRLTGHLLI